MQTKPTLTAPRTSVHRAAVAGLDPAFPWYASCDRHATLTGARSRDDARHSARNPHEWCDACRGERAALASALRAARRMVRIARLPARDWRARSSPWGLYTPWRPGGYVAEVACDTYRAAHRGRSERVAALALELFGATDAARVAGS